MKNILMLILIVAVSGCASSLPLPPEPKGKMMAINPDVVRLSDLDS